MSHHRAPSVSPISGSLVVRGGIILAAALLSAYGTWIFRSIPRGPSDLWVIWEGARLWLHGQNPYTLIGTPAADFPTRLFYPLPALLFASPLTAIPMAVVDPLLVGLAGGVLGWYLTRDGYSPGLLVFASFPWFHVLQTSQVCESLMLLGTVFPWAGCLFAAKPSIGAALWIMRPSFGRAEACLAVTVVTLLLWPTWIGDWRGAVASSGFLSTPLILRPGGCVLLLALLEWRNPKARLLVALACVPHTAVLYSAVILFLIPSTWAEGAILWIGSTVAAEGILQVRTYGLLDTYVAWSASWLLAGMYLPCLGLVLRQRRPVPVRVTPPPSADRYAPAPGQWQAA